MNSHQTDFQVVVFIDGRFPEPIEDSWEFLSELGHAN